MGYRFLQKLQYWMMGRNGTDQLSIALLIAGFVISLFSNFFWPLIFLSYAIYIWMLFRMFSRICLPASGKTRCFSGCGARLPSGFLSREPVFATGSCTGISSALTVDCVCGRPRAGGKFRSPARSAIRNSSSAYKKGRCHTGNCRQAAFCVGNLPSGRDWHCSTCSGNDIMRESKKF